MEDTKKKDDQLEKKVRELEAENRHLAQPLAVAQTDLDFLKKKLNNFDNVKMVFGVRSSPVSASLSLL